MRMRKRGFVLLGITSLALLLVVLLSGPAVSPPELKLLSVEPAGMLDDNGQMWLATIQISNLDTNWGEKHFLCLRDAKKPVQARVGQNWVTCGWHNKEGVFRGRLQPNGDRKIVLTLPAGMSSFRVSLQYTGTSVSFRGRPIKGPMLWVAERLPACLRFRFSRNFWRWLGFNRYEPRSSWRSVTLEFSDPSLVGR